MNSNALLLGKPPHYEIRLIFNSQGNYYEGTFVEANLILMKEMGVQSDTLMDAESLAVLRYGIDELVTKQKWAQPMFFNAPGKGVICYLLFFPQALTPAQVKAINQSDPFIRMVMEKGDGGAPLTGPHFSRAEAWTLIKTWYHKRTGQAPGAGI